MKNEITILKWLYYALIASLVLNILSHSYERFYNKPEIHIHYQDERK